MFYGPVLSRRFGYSLGVDIIPSKVCVYDCLYCQLGRTTCKTITRKKYLDIDFDYFGDELKRNIEYCPYIQYITFSGSGEPTLNTDIPYLIDKVKSITDIPVAVLTSGGTLGQESVLNDIKGADLIKVSLDGPDKMMMKKINRPSRGSKFVRNIEGLRKLINSCNGRIWLEIMILKDLNDSLECALKFRDLINSFDDKIEKIHLNTAVRPSGSKWVGLPEQERLEEIKSILGEKAENIEAADYSQYDGHLNNLEKEVVSLIKRRPSEIGDIAKALGINMNEAIKICQKLIKEGKMKYSIRRNNKYYIMKKEENR